MVVWRLHLIIPRASLSCIASWGWGLSKCHSGQITVFANISRNCDLTPVLLTAADIGLLAAMDERHDTPCGPAVKKLCERASTVFGPSGNERLAAISVSHLYNLRK